MNRNHLVFFVKLFFGTGVVIFSLFFFILLLLPSPLTIKYYFTSMFNNMHARHLVTGMYSNPYVFIKLYEYDIGNGSYDFAEQDLNLALGVCNEFCYYHKDILLLKQSIKKISDK